MASTEQLLVRIDATTEQLRRELKRADDQVARATGRMDRQLGRVDKAFERVNKAAGFAAKAIGGYLAVLGVSQLTRFAKQQIATTQAIAKAAETAGISTDALQELRFTFGQLADVTDQQLDMSLQRFNRRLGLAAEGGGAAKDTFAELGVGMRDVAGNVRASEDVLDDVLRALAAIESDALRAAKASEIFGEEAGPKLAQALGEGIGAINQLRQDAQDLGIVLDEDIIQNAEQIADEFDKAQRILNTSFMAALNEATPLLVTMAQQLALVARYWSEVFGETPQDAFEDLQQQIAGVQNQIARLGEQLRSSGNRIQGFAEAGADAAIIAEVGRFAEIQRARNAAIELLRKLTRKQGDTRLPPSSSGNGRPDTGGSGGGGGAPSDLPLGTIPDPDNVASVDLIARGRAAREAELAMQEWRRANEMIIMADGSLADLQLSFERTNKEAERMNRLGADIGMTFASAFEDAVVQADSLRNVILGLAQDLARLVLRQTVTVPLANSITSALPFGGARADGGPVAAGTGYVVGERGPELFRPGSNGAITPNHALGGNVTVNVINQNGQPLQASSQRTRRGPSGDMIVDVTVEQSLRRMAGNGQLDPILAPYGVQRQGGY